MSQLNRIKEFRRARGLTMQQLADAAGTSKGQIDKLEKGARRLTVDWMVRLSKPLECDPRALMPARAGEQPAKSWHTAAVFPGAVVAQGGKEARQNLLQVRALAHKSRNAAQLHFSGEAVDFVPRPAFLGHAQGAYALYMTGTAMIPMFRPGQLLFVNPHKLPAAGQGVVLVMKNKAVRIHEYVGEKGALIEVRSWHPGVCKFKVQRADIAEMHCVVGLSEG